MSINRLTDCLKMNNDTIYNETEYTRGFSMRSILFENNESYYDRISILARRGTFLVPDYKQTSRFVNKIKKEFLQLILPKYTSLRADTLKMFVEAYRATCPHYLRDFESLNQYIESRLLYRELKISDFDDKVFAKELLINYEE